MMTAMKTTMVTAVAIVATVPMVSAIIAVAKTKAKRNRGVPISVRIVHVVRIVPAFWVIIDHAWRRLINHRGWRRGRNHHRLVGSGLGRRQQLIGHRIR